MEILAPCKAIWTFWHLCYCAKMSMCRNVPMLKCSVPKIPLAENSSCQKLSMSKRFRVETSICRNVRSAERCSCQNVPVMKHLSRNDSYQNLRCRNGGKPRYLWPPFTLRYHLTGQFVELTRLFFLATYQKCG